MKKGIGKGLGKGLDVLLPDEPAEYNSGEIHQLRLIDVEPNKNQPRKAFDEEKLALLTESIKEHGVIQPIVVMKAAAGYTIVAGERRWRAAKKAGLDSIPAIIREYNKKEAAEIALIENLQREDLNPIEEALGYRSLMDDFDMTQEMVSQRIGRGRSSIANSLRLLVLPKPIQQLLVSGELSSGHARAILSVEGNDNRLEFAQMILDKQLSVRQAEALAKQFSTKKVHEKEDTAERDAYQIEIDAIGERLSSKFGTKVKIAGGAKKGKIEIEYYGSEDLERLLNMIM